MRKKILKIYGILLAICIPYLIWVSLTGLYIPCFYYTTTGLLCPGCGISHMFVALAGLDLPLAFSCNPVMLVLVVLWNVLALLCFLGKPAFVQKPRFLYTVLALSVAAMLIFAAVRNIA